MSLSLIFLLTLFCDSVFTLLRSIFTVNSTWIKRIAIYCIFTSLFPLNFSHAIEIKKTSKIEARIFPIRAIESSKSERVYLFEDPEKAQPKVGALLLLRKDGENIIAIRVLKTYPHYNKFAAKRVLSTYGLSALNLKSAYMAIQKLRDIPPPLSAPIDAPTVSEVTPLLEEPASEDALVDSNDLESTEEFTDDLEDVPDFSEEESQDYEALLEEIEALSDIDINEIIFEEIRSYDTDFQGLSVQFGMMRNISGETLYNYYSTVGIRYAFTPTRDIFFSGSTQDSLTLEVSSFLYAVNGFENTNDHYSLMPLHGIIRYNILPSQAWNFFFYVGALHNFILLHRNATNTGLSYLGSNLPAAGTGFMAQLGPKWYLRVDLGIDMFSLGLNLRF